MTNSTFPSGFYGRLHGTGYRNDSLFNSGFIFCMIAFVLIIQSSLSAVWSGEWAALNISLCYFYH